jgi:hypothetical protein
MSKPNLDRIYTNLSSRAKEAQINVQDFRAIGKNAFKVVAATYGVNGEADFDEAVVAMTKGAARMVPKSFRQKGRICVATIMANAKSQPMDASFIPVTASTARDAGGNIWSVVDDGGSKRVVLESADDLADILKARRAGCKVFAQPMEAGGIVTASVRNGDLVRYVDTAAGTTNWGLAFHAEEGLKVIGEDLTPKITSIHAVVASVPRANLPEEARKVPVGIETAKLDSAKLSTILDYLQKAWAKTPQAQEMLSQYRKLADKAA